ncbi:hypothetical protein [Thalassomonas haliotis]|uniref:Uncharacterized protein n=1 Tax=Thalassomonas haliotis TaxID=485448 RepID=A0ABY7VBS3_9GAMM|nr:hypothetical protein [Thalassomonas haliotis]WDE10761.1 hypothetical protein H3N35_21320 [Thalassomonas haliotis]
MASVGGNLSDLWCGCTVSVFETLRQARIVSVQTCLIDGEPLAPVDGELVERKLAGDGFIERAALKSAIREGFTCEPMKVYFTLSVGISRPGLVKQDYLYCLGMDFCVIKKELTRARLNRKVLKSGLIISQR